MSVFNLFRNNQSQPPLVQQAFTDVQTMLKNGRVMFEAAAAHLLDNEILDVDLGKLDQAINRGEQDLRQAVLEHLNIDPNRELVFCLKLLSIVHEAERIGDLAKSLSNVANLAHQPRLGAMVEPLREHRKTLLLLFDQAQKSFVQTDEESARKHLQQHEQLKAALNTYIAQVAETKELSANEAVVYALGARMMSRVSSHLANIASTVAHPFQHIRRGNLSTSNT